MTGAARLLADLHRRGVRVVAEGDALRLRGPASAVAAVRDAVAAAKTEILQALESRAKTPERIPESPENRASGISGMRNGPPAGETALPEPWPDRLRAARSWPDLAEIVEDAQAAYVAGELPGEVVERLAVQANVLSRRLPEHRPPPEDGREIPAADLLPPDAPPDTCHACRGGSWWVDRRSGRRICRVCHPPPAPEFEA